MSNHTSSFNISINSICVENLPVSVNFECDSAGDYIYVESVILESDLELFNDDNEAFVIPSGQNVIELITGKDLDVLVDQIYKNF